MNESEHCIPVKDKEQTAGLTGTGSRQWAQDLLSYSDGGASHTRLHCWLNELPLYTQKTSLHT